MISRIVALLVLIVLPASAQERLTPELLWKLGRVSGGDLAPNGESVLFSVRRYDLRANKGDSDLFVVSLKSGAVRVLTRGPASEGQAQWVRTPRGLRVFFVSKRPGSKAAQVYALDPVTGDMIQVTDVPGGVGELKVSSQGDRIAYTHRVKMHATLHELYPDLPMADARLIDGLMYRHWDHWNDETRSHLFTAALGKDGRAGRAVDLMEGLDADCPVPPFAGAEQFTWSPDGEEIAFTAKIVNDWAASTDSDVYVVKWDGQGEKTCVSTGMDGYDNDPVYSPDGRFLAWHSMKTPGFESDRNRLMLLDRKKGTVRELTRGLDRTVHEATWLPDGSAVIVRSEDRGTDQLFEISLATGDLRRITSGDYNWSLRDISADGKTLIVARQNMIRPWELGRMARDDGSWTALTDVNKDVYAHLELPSVKARWTRATDGKSIHSWVIYPPGFDPNRRYPTIVYCQGGPQGQIGQWFSYRWNFHLMAAQGYVVLAVNRRGLPGFGRAWNDEISKDWGGQAMQDILAATDAMMLEPYVDAHRMGAVGASFGGYTVYWLMGHHENRFQCMIAHDGVFNLASMYGSTEELFFVNHDLDGPYWKSKEAQAAFDRFSPHRYVANWKTPLLIFHGGKDYRVPDTQGLEAFTAAQVKGIPSRLVYFPNEGHWVLSPQNGVLWHRVFFDWLGRWLGER